MENKNIQKCSVILKSNKSFLGVGRTRSAN